MTYSICVRERADDGWRFGAATAARVPAVGGVTPHVDDHGAVAVAGVADAALGQECLGALAEGRRLDSVLDSLATEDGSARRQIHGVGVDAAATHTGPDCQAHAAARVGDDYTVGGTAMADDEVLDALERGYTTNERDTPLVRRLLTALAAGERAGGDGRDLPVGSAAVVVRGEHDPLYHDLRVDASERPIADLRETYRQAKQGYEAALETYGQTENS
ncbi:DUF1028 domain-containing protein [Haloplanus sp. C73]|uniref:DUF1028 domain-containing protein n=1 Tax=Haloplanus sp. C73 TaxID=3421641 RepID=UPI003EB722E4